MGLGVELGGGRHAVERWFQHERCASSRAASRFRRRLRMWPRPKWVRALDSRWSAAHVAYTRSQCGRGRASPPADGGEGSVMRTWARSAPTSGRGHGSRTTPPPTPPKGASESEVGGVQSGPERHTRPYPLEVVDRAVSSHVRTSGRAGRGSVSASSHPWAGSSEVHQRGVGDHMSGALEKGIAAKGDVGAILWQLSPSRVRRREGETPWRSAV